MLWRIDSSYNVESSSEGMGHFSSTGKFNVSGNVLSLISNTDFKTKYNLNKDYQFAGLFYNAINLISARNLILQATSLTRWCYEYMFNGCTSLIYGPKLLPALSLNEDCYKCMFKNCTNLLESPILLGNLSTGTISSDYYVEMFINCTSLRKITMLSEIVHTGHLTNWVKGTTSGGIFIKNSKSTFDNIGDSGIPAGWEIIDEEVPEEE